MRVITGTAKGRKLKELTSADIRPTTDMVKEAIFSIVQFDIEGRRVLDMFAGTGQLGIEALSRGAASCVFIDQSRDAVKLIRENIIHCKLDGGEVVQADAMSYLARADSFDLIFIDPPYDTPLCDKALQKIFEFDILTEGGIIVCETRWENGLPEAELPYFRHKEYRYGKVKLTIYKKERQETDLV